MLDTLTNGRKRWARERDLDSRQPRQLGQVVGQRGERVDLDLQREPEFERSSVYYHTLLLLSFPPSSVLSSPLRPSRAAPGAVAATFSPGQPRGCKSWASRRKKIGRVSFFQNKNANEKQRKRRERREMVERQRENQRLKRCRWSPGQAKGINIVSLKLTIKARRNIEWNEKEG